jgi:hypothetical protein
MFLYLFLRAIHIVVGVFSGFLFGGIVNYNILKIDGNHPVYRSIVILCSTCGGLMNGWMAINSDALVLLSIELLFIFLVIVFYTPPPSAEE